MFKLQPTKYFGGHNFRRKKVFGGQNFPQQAKFSALLSAEILSDKVYIDHNIIERIVCNLNKRILHYLCHTVELMVGKNVLHFGYLWVVHATCIWDFSALFFGFA